MKAFDFNEQEELSIYRIVAAITHIGQIGFFEENSCDVIANYKPIRDIA